MPDMTAADVTAAMLELYAKPGTWTRNGIAQDAAGREVAADGAEAVTWSLEGALERVIGDWEDPDADHGENMRRQRLLADVFDACGVDLAAFSDLARRQNVVVGLLMMASTA